MGSATPPGGTGTMMVTGRDGYACAVATRENAGSATVVAARCRNCLRGSFMRFLEIGAPWSVDLQHKRLYHRRPERNIGLEGSPEFLGRPIETGFETRIDQFLFIGIFRKRLAHRLCNLLDDRLRRASGSDRPNRILTGQPRKAHIRHRRKLG